MIILNFNKEKMFCNGKDEAYKRRYVICIDIEPKDFR